MLILKKALSRRNDSFLAIMVFAFITVIITILFNFKGTFKVSAAKGLDATALQEMNQKQIGYITKAYEKGGRRYLSFEEVKFLTGKEAVKAARKNGNAIYENGQYYVLDDYYIVNEDKGFKDYVIDGNASLSLLGFMVSSNGDDITNKRVDYEKFKAAVNNKRYPKLCYIYIKSNVIIEVEPQYVP
jgi:hypothetical protein